MNNKTIDEWLRDYEAFNYAFRHYCFQQFQAFGVKADFVPDALKGIHRQWAEDCQEWQASQVEASEKLSYLKIIALLLHNLCHVPFLGTLSDHEYSKKDFTYAGPRSEFVENRRDLIDGREIILAFDYCFLVLDWIERNRTDKVGDYVVRLTSDMRHDFLSYLLSGDRERKAIYLILKALFLRDGGATN